MEEKSTTTELSQVLNSYKDVCSYFMFDTKINGQSGGTGISFNWAIINELDIPQPYFLSGGLSHMTVNSALELLSGNPPLAIDVSSKIEESVGIKDYDKLSLLIEAVNLTSKV